MKILLISTFLMLTGVFMTSPVKSRSINKESIGIDLLIITDWSSSLEKLEKKIVQALHAYIHRQKLSPYDLKIGIITFDIKSRTEVPLTADKNRLDSVLRVLRKRKVDSYNTRLNCALATAPDVFATSARERGRYATQIIIFISDGRSDDQEYAIITAEKLKKSGVVIAAISIGKRNIYDIQTLKSISSSGYFRETDGNDLKRILLQLDFTR